MSKKVDVGGSSVDPDGAESSNRNVFIFQIARYDDGGGAIEIRFADDPDDRASSIESEINGKNGELDPSLGDTHTHASSNFQKPTSGDLLRRASSQWTSTAIAFFQIVPKFRDQTFKAASVDVIERMVAYAEEASIRKREYRDDQTSVTEYEIEMVELPIAANKIGKSTHAVLAAEALGRSSLGALVSEYESLISRILTIVSQIRPGAFLSSSDSISLGDLSKYSSIQEAKEALLERKIEDLLHAKSHVQVLEWINEKFGVNLTSDKNLISEFIEICQRRHLLTHAGGIVNQRYLTMCSDAGCKVEGLAKIGERVVIDSKYLRRATARVFQIGFFTLHILWQKLIPSDVEESCRAVLGASHDFLENDLTKMCMKLCDFTLSSSRPPSDKVVAYFTINKALSYLNDRSLNGLERRRHVETVLASRDWSVNSPTLALALACVREEFSDLARLAELAAADGVTYLSANTWVVFRGVRDRPEFMEKFRRD